MNASPLGRWAEPAAVFTALGIVIVWILSLVAVVQRSPELDAAATLSIGIILGQRSTTNGAARLALAAHKRLDSIGAAPADDGTPSA